MRILLTLLVISVVALSGCGPRDRIEICRLDRVARQAAEGGVSADSLRKMSGGVRSLMIVTGQDSVDEEAFLAWYGASEFSEVFGPDVDAMLPDLLKQEQEFAAARKILSECLPEVEFPSEIYGVITPYRQSVVTVDTVMIIGLNHYLGADYEGYESFGPERKQKTPERMTVEAVGAMVMGQFPFRSDDGEPTLLQMMLYDGAVIAAVNKALPDKDIAALLGIDDEAANRLRKDEREVWRALAEKGLLFSTDGSVNARLLMAADNSDRLYPGCPGRAVRYIGWRMVESYIKHHSDATLSDLLKPDFYNSPDALRQAAYNP